MKRKILGLFLATAMTASAFAQEVPNSVFVDFGTTVIGIMAGGFGIGLGYERGITDNFSAIINASYIGTTITAPSGATFDKLEYTGAGVGIHARYYPLGNSVKRWFIDAGGAYSYISMAYGDTITSNLFEIGILTGWKFVFGESGGFFLEPGLGYSLIFGDLNTPNGSWAVPQTGGFRLWLGMGWAF